MSFLPASSGHSDRSNRHENPVDKLKREHPDLAPGIEYIVQLIKPAHDVMRAIMKQDMELIRSTNQKLVEAVAVFYDLEPTFENKEKMAATMSIILSAAMIISPSIYGAEDDLKGFTV